MSCLLLAAMMLLSACGNAGAPLPTPSPVDPAVVQTEAVATFAMSLTLAAPTHTPTPLPSATPTATATSTPTATPTATNVSIPVSELMKTYIAYYWIYPVEMTTACTYYVLPYIAYPIAERTGNYEQDIRTALNILFADHSPGSGVLTNPIGRSNLTISGFHRSGITLNVELSGTLYRNFYYPMTWSYSLFCPDKQARDQVFRTIWQFKDILAQNGITDVVVWYDGQLLDDLLLNDFSGAP